MYTVYLDSMTQKKYNPDLVEAYLKEHPEASNINLYEHCNATTDNQKGYIRKKKSRLTTQKDSGKTPRKPGKPKEKKSKEVKTELEEGIQEILERIQYDNINEESIENMLLRLANEGTIDTALVRCMLDFFIKIKSKTDTMDEDLDMEALKEIGLITKT